MKIIGNVLVHRSLFETKVGEKGYVHQTTFRLFEKKLYFYQIAPYFVELAGEFCVPFERIGEGEADFCFDFDQVPVSLQNQIEDPRKEEGWLGPFDVDLENFSFNRLYERTPVSELFDVWKDLVCASGDFQEVQEIRRRKFNRYYQTAPLHEIEKERSFLKGELDAWEHDREEWKEDGEWTEENEQSYKTIRKEIRENLYELKRCFIERSAIELTEMDEKELACLFDWTQKNSPDDYERLGLIQTALKKRRHVEA